MNNPPTELTFEQELLKKIQMYEVKTHGLTLTYLDGVIRGLKIAHEIYERHNPPTNNWDF